MLPLPILLLSCLALLPRAAEAVPNSDNAIDVTAYSFPPEIGVDGVIRVHKAEAISYLETVAGFNLTKL
ncbi:Uu.00g102460.m01.CDS01 [Anthostomella pinea]|uniref:Uu.00g102460.m01.CDS01 n=1 Tax=Anthostomella pinea TaxID=933095 RepID=A0AAI8VDF4_9PEZI|nr:Uu.00g102460.m01.CDS01 [Anthostomella pinea]